MLTAPFTAPAQAACALRAPPGSRAKEGRSRRTSRLWRQTRVPAFSAHLRALEGGPSACRARRFSLAATGAHSAPHGARAGTGAHRAPHGSRAGGRGCRCSQSTSRPLMGLRRSPSAPPFSRRGQKGGPATEEVPAVDHAAFVQEAGALGAPRALAPSVAGSRRSPSTSSPGGLRGGAGSRLGRASPRANGRRPTIPPSMRASLPLGSSRRRQLARVAFLWPTRS